MDKGRVKKLILPLILEQLFAVSVGLIDTFMVSKVSEAAVSGVSLVDNINTLVIQVMAALSAGGIVVISQYIGDKNESLAKKTGFHLETLMNIFSISVLFIYLVLGKSILGKLFGKIDIDVMDAAVIYMLVSGFSFLFWGMYTAGSAILRCQEDTKTPMKVSVIMNLLNAILNALFVFIFHMGVLGVAVATLISRAFAGLTMRVILSTEKNGLRLKKKKISDLSLLVFRKILAMGIPSGVENGMFHVGKIVVASMIAALGTSVIAANSIAYQIIEFPNIPGNTIGLALVVIVGQDIGAGKKEYAINNTKHMLKYAYIGDWISKFILFLAAPLIVGAFGLSSEATNIAVLVLRCFAVASIPVWPLSFTLPHSLRGAGDVKYSMIVSVLSMWLGRILVSFILIKIFDLGILGVWFGMFTDWYIRGIGYLLRFKSKKWLNKKII